MRSATLRMHSSLDMTSAGWSAATEPYAAAAGEPPFAPRTDRRRVAATPFAAGAVASVLERP